MEEAFFGWKKALEMAEESSERKVQSQMVKEERVILWSQAKLWEIPSLWAQRLVCELYRGHRKGGGRRMVMCLSFTSVGSEHLNQL